MEIFLKGTLMITLHVYGGGIVPGISYECVWSFVQVIAVYWLKLIHVPTDKFLNTQAFFRESIGCIAQLYPLS